MTAGASQSGSTDSKPATTTDQKNDLTSMPMSEVEKQLCTSPDGLSQAEAEKRLAQYGPNEIAEHKTNPLLKFLGYFWGPIPWMIEVAVILSGAVQHWADFFIILVLLVANGVVGYSEEHQAGNAIDALKAKLATTARVRRDGEWVTQDQQQRMMIRCVVQPLQRAHRDDLLHRRAQGSVRGRGHLPGASRRSTKR